MHLHKKNEQAYMYGITQGKHIYTAQIPQDLDIVVFARDARVWISRASCTLWIRYFHYFVRKAYKKTKSATIAMRVPASYRRNYDIACMVFATHDCFTIQRWTIRVAIH